MSIAKVENYNGYPAIMVDGVAYPPMMATIRTNMKDHIKIDREYIRELGKAGIKIFFVICDTEWLKPGAFELFKEEAEAILAEVPDAYLVPRIGLHPPMWWIEENPDELVRYSDGSLRPMLLYTESYVADIPASYSLCSEKWRQDAGKALSEIYDKIETLPYADRIIGYFLAAGNTSEWYYGAADDQSEHKERGACSDISDAFKQYFSKYLKETYKTEDALKKAWKDETATFENPGIADFDSRFFILDVSKSLTNPPHLYSTDDKPAPVSNGTNIGEFLDINNYRKTFDYFRAWHTGTADSVIYFADIIKKKSKDKLVGAFYGSFGCTDYLYCGTAGGVLKILDSDVVDFLAAPGVYENRQPGGFTGQREMVDSFRLRNRMFIVEEDTRTHNENRFYQRCNELYTAEDTINIMKRDFGRNICEDIQAWWFDQLIGGKRYKDPKVYELIKKQQEIAKKAYEKDRTKHSDIAFIYDEESIAFSSQKLSFDAIELMRDYEISKIGTSVDQYYHNDFANPDMPSYKLYVFCNVYSLTDEERKAIINKLKKDNAVALWMYAPGIVNLDKEKPFDVDNLSELIGIKTKMCVDDIMSKIKFDGEPHKLAENIDRGEIHGFNYNLQKGVTGPSMSATPTFLYPYFYTDDDEATVLAHYLETDEGAFSVKEQDGWTSVFCGSKILSCDIFREVAKYAGCHIFNDRSDVVYASRNYITIHASTSGTKILNFPFKCCAYEVYEEKLYGENTDKIEFSMLKGETKMFELVKE